MWECQCCGRLLPARAIEHKAVNEEGQRVSVGSDCIKHIKAAGSSGHFNEKTGSQLWSIAGWASYQDDYADEEEVAS